jgi:hypothetical protein
MKHLKNYINKSKVTDGTFYHGSYFLTRDAKDLNLPLWITKSKLNAIHFSVSMKYDEVTKKNKFVGQQSDVIGYVYTLEISNADIDEMKFNEFVLNSGDIIISKIEEVKVSGNSFVKLPKIVREI